MSIFRLLLIAAALYLLWRIGRVLWSKWQAPAAPSEPTYLPMAQCAKCGSHVPSGTLSPSGLCGRCVSQA